MKTLRNSLRTAPAVMAMGAMFLFAAVPQMRADDDHRECREHTAKAQAQVDKEIARHGEHSPEADRARARLNAERESCWNREHGYWGADNRWHTERDWEDHH